MHAPGQENTCSEGSQVIVVIVAAYLELEIQTEPLYNYIVIIIIFLKLNPLLLLLGLLFGLPYSTG